MKVDVILFALAKELVGSGTVQIEVPDSATVGQLREKLLEKHPKLKPVLHRCMLAVDEEYADDDATLTPGAGVACIPPVSGGQPRTDDRNDA